MHIVYQVINQMSSISKNTKCVQLVFSNPDVLVVFKPSGLLTHGTSKSTTTSEKTLADVVCENFQDIHNIGEDATRSGIVHRLDRQTSGLVIIARTHSAYTQLKHKFANQQVKKKYFALVWGVPKQQSGVVEKPITAHKGKRRTVEVWSQQKPNTVREATTEWRCVQQVGDKYALLDVAPQTGRTHQIRVHLASIGHPVVCDPLYSGKKKCPAELGRLFLQAYYVQFELNNNKVEVQVDMEQQLQAFVSLSQKSAFL